MTSNKSCTPSEQNIILSEYQGSGYGNISSSALTLSKENTLVVQMISELKCVHTLKLFLETDVRACCNTNSYFTILFSFSHNYKANLMYQ